MQGVSGDFVLAWRRLASARAFTLFSILTLGLGIGATTAIYSVVHAILLRGPGYPDADRVAKLYHADPRRGGSGPMLSLSAPDFEDYRRMQTSFGALAAWTRFRHPLTTGNSAELVTGEMVGGEYFRVIGAAAALGRTIQPSDDSPDAPKVIVLSDNLWRRKFGADQHLLGRMVGLGGDRFQVIGVMPRWFGGVDMPNLTPTPAWIPMSSSTPINRWDPANREHRWLHAIGRLKPEMTMGMAQAEFRTIGERLDAERPIGRTSGEHLARFERRRQWFLMPASEVRMHESVDPLARPLAATTMVAVALVLLVVCTNIANLTLARGSARRHDNAVRLALGASRWRLIREHLVESALVTAAGGLVSVLLARFAMVRLLSTTIDVAPGLVVQVNPTLSAPVIGIAMASTFICLLVFGLVPALHNTGGHVRDALASDGQSAPRRWRGRRSLIAAQVAVSGGLVAVSILCAEQAIATARRDSGVDLDRLAFARVDFAMHGKREPYARAVLDRALQQAQGQVGVEAAALASGLPVGSGPEASVAVDTSKMRDAILLGSSVRLLTSTPDIFRVLGVTIMSGSTFGEGNSAGSVRVAVINRSLATSLFGAVDPVGRDVSFQLRRFLGEDVPPINTATIVGVVGDLDVISVGRRREGVLFVPFAQQFHPSMSLIVRTSPSASAVPDRLRRIFSGIDPELAVIEASNGTDIVSAATLVVRVGAAAAGLLGTLALALAMVGLCGVISDLVARRTHEIGVRIALGADPGGVTAMVLRDGLRPVVAGLVVAIGLGAIARIAFRPLFLRMMPAFDPVVVAAVPAVFVAAALIASYLPARRAARVDPSVALRHL